MFIPTIDYLMSAPLAALLAAPGVHVVATQITDPEFTGYVFRKGERVEVALPPGRTPIERDCIVRYLIGHALRVKGLAPLPAPLQAVEI